MTMAIDKYIKMLIKNSDKSHIFNNNKGRSIVNYRPFLFVKWENTLARATSLKSRIVIKDIFTQKTGLLITP